MTLNSEIKKLFLETEVDKIDIQNKKISCVKKDGTRFSQEYDKSYISYRFKANYARYTGE